MWSRSRDEDGAWSLFARPVTNASHRRVRDERLRSYRAFAQQHDWQVLGLHQDLSRRYPVEPLLGALSAQAELALSGEWVRWTAMLASVLVRAGAVPREHRRLSDAVQLTILETGPPRVQFTAVFTGRGFDVVALSRTSADDDGRVQALLEAAGGRDRLRPGDHVAADEVELVHVRRLHGRRREVDVEGPLVALAGIATSLGL